MRRWVENKHSLAEKWHRDFNLYAEDLYPGRYTQETCLELAEQALEIKVLATEKQSSLMVHYYLRPEFHEIADKLGDSLALSRHIQEVGPPRVDFQAVFFMGATAKTIAGNNSRIFVSDTPDVLGCSLVFGTDHAWLENWKRENPDGLLVTYINSDAYTKSISDFISTSRNTAQIIAHAAMLYPERKILVLPDKFLARVMKSKALKILGDKDFKIDPKLIEIYEEQFGGFKACCYIHEQFGPDAIDVAMVENPEAELMIHPECGCASYCLYRVEEEKTIPHSKAFFLSTEQMIQHALTSGCTTFIVSTEPGLLYALRKRLPNKKFIPVSAQAHCRYMKGNTFEKLLVSLKQDRLEVVLCENCPKCTDPKVTFCDERQIHIPKEIAKKARLAIDRMLTIT